ncbi:MAG TPA: nodulation protein NfeD [Myxococcales bacterium]|nr:nodulation protein NfeD [Myxococcales bacterium]
MIAAVAAASFVAYAELTGSVDPGSARYLIDAIHDAEVQGAEALIIRLDTPGGLLSATRDIVQAELSARVPVIVWVGPPGARAGSAGVFVTLAAHIAAMAPSSNIGAAHPVGIGGDGKDPDSQTLFKKIENDTTAFIHGIAERRSRNIDWAEKAVRESVSITASEALREKVVDVVAEDVSDLLRKVDGRKVQLGDETRRLKTAGVDLRPVEWTVRDRVVHALADPQIALLIGMLGVIGIMLEMFHPGTIVPGVVGAICLIIAGVAFQMLPVNIGALALCLLGVGLLVAEMYVGGHGWFIGAGVVCIVVGCLFLIGHTGRGFWADPDFGLGWRVVLPVGAALGIISATLVWKFTSSAVQPLRSGAPGLLGEVGEVREAVGPGGGRVLVHGELWSARARAPIPEGARVRVVGVSGLLVDVAPVEPQLKEAT